MMEAMTGLLLFLHLTWCLDNSRIPSSEISQTEGKDITIGCNSVTPVEWVYKEYGADRSDFTTVSASLITNAMVDSDNNLTISGVHRLNQGYYECSGLNEQGEKFFSQLFLIVRGE